MSEQPAGPPAPAATPAPRDEPRSDEAKSDSLLHQRPPSAAALAEVARVSQTLETATPLEIIRWAAETYGNALTMATAFGPEGMAIIHMISQLPRDVSIFNLETGYQFDETLAMVDRIRQRYGIEVKLERPDQSIEEFEAEHGGPQYKTNPDFCCGQRKLVVLHRAIAGKAAWISAIRRDQSADRARAAIVYWDKRFELIKVNPLANWKKNDVWKFITDNDIPYNPLHDQGYTSIGCQPCTRAVLFGEDERAGRWSGTQKTECGLHTLGEDDLGKSA